MKPLRYFFLFGLTVFLPASITAATSIVRGPYLQSATPSSLIIRWRTDSADTSFVRYGAEASLLTSSAKAEGSSTEHIVLLKDLQPVTRYFYSVGGAPDKPNKDGDDKPLKASVYSFTTPPPVGPPKPTRIWVLGDPGTKNATQLAVRDVYYHYTGDRPTDLWLLLGDNAYPDGTDFDYQKAIFEVYPTMLRTSPVWSALGNHDGHSANSNTQSGPYFDIFSFPTRGQAGGMPSGTEAYYSFDYANIHFICLDSHNTERTIDGAMMQWLKADLAATGRDWIVAFFHHPTYTKGTHDSDRETQLVEMRQVFLRVLEAGGTDLVLTGHSHVYERSYFIDGHYGPSATFDAATHVKQVGDGRPQTGGAYRKPRGRVAHAGEVSVVTGSAGQAGSKKATLDHPAMWISLSEPGSVVLDVDNLNLDVVFLNDKGEKRDWFSISKDPATKD